MGVELSSFSEKPETDFETWTQNLFEHCSLSGVCGRCGWRSRALGRHQEILWGGWLVQPHTYQS